MVFKRFSKLGFQRRLPSETLVGVSPPFAELRNREKMPGSLFWSNSGLCSVTPYFCCLKGKGSGFPHIFTASPHSEGSFSWYEDAGVAFTRAFPSPLGSAPFFQTFSISLPAGGWPRLPQDFRVQEAREEPWAGAPEATPSLLCDVNQNCVARPGPFLHL